MEIARAPLFHRHAEFLSRFVPAPSVVRPFFRSELLTDEGLIASRVGDRSASSHFLPRSWIPQPRFSPLLVSDEKIETHILFQPHPVPPFHARYGCEQKAFIFRALFLSPADSPTGVRRLSKHALPFPTATRRDSIPSPSPLPRFGSSSHEGEVSSL